MEKRKLSKEQVKNMMNYNREDFFKNPTTVRKLNTYDIFFEVYFSKTPYLCILEL